MLTGDCIHIGGSCADYQEFREKVLEGIGCENIWLLEKEVRKRHGKLNLTPSIALLDLDSLSLFYLRTKRLHGGLLLASCHS